MTEKQEYLCMYCNEVILEDNMVSWNCKTKKGFCRECASKLSLEEMMEIEEDGFNYGKQLSFLAS